jgi:hypothetical protein
VGGPVERPVAVRDHADDDDLHSQRQEERPGVAEPQLGQGAEPSTEDGHRGQGHDHECDQEHRLPSVQLELPSDYRQSGGPP